MPSSETVKTCNDDRGYAQGKVVSQLQGVTQLPVEVLLLHDTLSIISFTTVIP